MAGVKGRSGRKSNSNEEYKLQTIEECWKLVRENIHNAGLPLQFRVDLASKHTVKSIPTELSGDIGINLVAMGTIVKDGDTLNFNIGGHSVDPSEDTGHSGQDPSADNGV